MGILSINNYVLQITKPIFDYFFLYREIQEGLMQMQQAMDSDREQLPLVSSSELRKLCDPLSVVAQILATEVRSWHKLLQLKTTILF